MLGTDVVVAEGERLAQRKLEHLLRTRRERDLAGRDLVALTDDPRHLGANLLDSDVERLEHARGEAFLFAQQPEQDVLRADVVVLQGTRLVLGEYHHLTSPFGKSFEQVLRPLLSRRNSGGQLTRTSGPKVCPMVSDAYVGPVRGSYEGSSTVLRPAKLATAVPPAVRISGVLDVPSPVILFQP